jgi:hypothetical protein
MAKSIVSDTAHSCDLEQVGFHALPVTLSVTGKDATRGTFDLRVFVPESLEGNSHFIKDIGSCVITVRGLVL